MSWCLEGKKRVSFSAFAMTAHWWPLPRQGTFQVVSNLQTNCDILGGGTYSSLAEVVASTLVWCHIHLNSPSSTRNNAKEYVECFFASFAWLNKNPRSLQSLASLMVKFSYTWHHMLSTFSSPSTTQSVSSRSVVPGPATSALLRNLSELQILGPHSQQAEAGTQKDPKICVSQTSRWFWRLPELENHELESLPRGFMCCSVTPQGKWQDSAQNDLSIG